MKRTQQHRKRGSALVPSPPFRYIRSVKLPADRRADKRQMAGVANRAAVRVSAPVFVGMPVEGAGGLQTRNRKEQESNEDNPPPRSRCGLRRTNPRHESLMPGTVEGFHSPG